MLKKRLIFALLWDAGYFSLSRNFRLQRVGDMSWLRDQYRFDILAASIDELLILDVTRGPRLTHEFQSTVSSLASTIQVPISVGGGVWNSSDVRALMGSGADKVILNSALLSAPGDVRTIRDRFGQQSIVGSMDVVRVEHGYEVMVENGTVPVGPLDRFFEENVRDVVGEILLNSIDRDGTGQGLDLTIPLSLPTGVEQPVILMGGTGRPDHVVEGLCDKYVDAVATSNLLNFVGDGLDMARSSCTAAHVPIPDRLTSVAVSNRVLFES